MKKKGLAAVVTGERPSMAYNWILKEKPYLRSPGPPPAAGKIHNQNLLVLLLVLLLLWSS